MRKCRVFIGSSHPELGQLICDRLGIAAAPCKISKFANGETGCDIGVSVRDTHAIIVIGSADQVNDKLIEMLVLISGCRGGSASKVTVVIPMFPYSKQSKMKKHRGAITARMLANLITNAGADHVITMDLHAAQMQGFFSRPVDNLSAGPTLARWIRLNVQDYSKAVIVSKNPGGTKRVTALADALKVNFAMIHTDRRRAKNLSIREAYPPSKNLHYPEMEEDLVMEAPSSVMPTFGELEDEGAKSELSRQNSSGSIHSVNNIHIARVLQGHVVSEDKLDSTRVLTPDSTLATEKHHHAALGGSGSHENEDEDEVDYSLEQVITLVGDVRGRTAIILDDMIDKPDSFVAAAEHCRLSCGARSVYVVGTHGVFSKGSLEVLSECPYIDHIVVTNTYPILQSSPKLHIIDISGILAECIRRNHNGESISTLFKQLATI